LVLVEIAVRLCCAAPNYLSKVGKKYHAATCRLPKVHFTDNGTGNSQEVKTALRRNVKE
jgi:hypothetical protein